MAKPRCLICLFVLALPAFARDLTAQQVLDRVVSTYSSLQAVHLVAERTETAYPAGGAQSSAEYELATASGGRYLARLKQPPQQALAVSDGAAIWLALNSKKQWSRVPAASQEDDTDEEHDARAASAALHDSLENVMLHQFLRLAKTVQHPMMANERDFDLGRERAHCYAIRAHAGTSEIELFVDRQRFVVLQYQQKTKSPDAPVEIVMKFKLVELNQEVADSLFHFEPEPGWTEVGTLPSLAEPIHAGERAADFTAGTLDGASVALAGLRGSVVVLDFWATWCMPCREEFPAMEKISAELGGAVRFYGISDESPDTVRQFVEENRCRMPMLLDSNREMRRRYGVHKIPALFVIDRHGVVRQQFIGARSESELRAAIRAVVDSNPPNR